MIEANTEAIVRLAWSRILGLDDDALAGGVDEPAVREHDETIMVVTLFDRIAVLGPSWFLDAAVADPYPLVDRHRLLEQCAGRPVELIGQAELAVTDTYVPDDHAAARGIGAASLRAVPVAPEATFAREIERSCDPADVDEAGLADRQHLFVTLDEHDAATAGAGYDEWRGLLAHLAVLTPPQHRRRGWGEVAAAIAGNDALDSGLVPQWRARVGNPASRALAARLGYQPIGSQTTVRLPPA